MILYEQKDIDRFYSKIDIITDGEYKDCWKFDSYKNKFGYCDFKLKSHNIHAHRFMYQIWHPDEDIDKMCVCHKCDNPWCVNPDHLWLGTYLDNNRDRRDKDRGAKGSLQGSSKLTEEDVVEILDNIIGGYFVFINDIAKHYNISNHTIKRILNNIGWKHVTKKYDLSKIKSMLIWDQRCKNGRSKLTYDDVIDIKERLKNGETQKSISELYGVHNSSICNISKGNAYKNI